MDREPLDDDVATTGGDRTDRDHAAARVGAVDDGDRARRAAQGDRSAGGPAAGDRERRVHAGAISKTSPGLAAVAAGLQPTERVDRGATATAGAGHDVAGGGARWHRWLTAGGDGERRLRAAAIGVGDRGAERYAVPADSSRALAARSSSVDLLPVGTTTAQRANVIGLGLIGGSVALALRERGWHVSGDDHDPARLQTALDRSVVDSAGLAADADITIVAVPVLALVDQVKRALAETSGVVTDVGSVKAAVCAAIDDPRFVGGHPMAGSELDGLDGADASMFQGAVWVLTPTSSTGDTTFSAVASLVAELGTDVVALDPTQHDDVVAVVSHVPHLTAATLMGLAAERAEEHAPLLRLAAGGFRDMTRIASGQPGIWLDICAENRPAIIAALDGMIAGLGRMRAAVAADARGELHDLLQRARDARTNLPTRVTSPESLAELRIPIPDRPGAAAEVFTLAAQLGVNIDSFEVVHSIEGNRGVAVVLVDADKMELYRGGLLARGFKPSAQRLS